jgi:hypothetical protein
MANKVIKFLKKTDMKNQIKTFTIRDAEAGNVIEVGLHYSKAYMLVLDYEREDKRNGTYTPDFYEIIAEN